MKYDVRFCGCGTLLFVPEETIDKALHEDKEVLLICGRCGRAYYIGADHQVYDDEHGHHDEFMMYTREPVEDKFVLDETTEQKPHTVFWTKGVRVPMKTGEYARSHSCDIFSDMWYPDGASYLGDMKLENFMSLYEKVKAGTADDKEKERFMRFISWMIPYLENIHEWKKNQSVVDMARLNRELTPEQKESVMRYSIRAFDWHSIGEKMLWE